MEKVISKIQPIYSDYLQSISIIYGVEKKLFLEQWQEFSGWEWLKNLQVEVEQFDVTETENEMEAAFFVAVIQQIDLGKLKKMAQQGEELVVLFDQNPEPIGNVQQPDPILNHEVANITTELEITTEGQESLWKQVKILSPEKQKRAIELLKNLLMTYHAERPFLELVAAVLLCFTPAGTPASVAQWDQQEIKISAGTMRFLGQSFFGREVETIQAALHLLASRAPGPTPPWKNRYEQLWHCILLYLIFSYFSDWPRSQQIELLKRYSWWALRNGVPLHSVIAPALAEELFPTTYIIHSGSLATGLIESNTIIESNQGSLVVGQFIKDYSAFAGKDELKNEIQDAYIKKTAGIYGWVEPVTRDAKKLLQLYLHLREGDLVDYRGLLSDEQVKPKVYRWNEIIQRDLTDKEIEKIKDYLTYLHRPERIKMEMIVAFETVPWNQNPYLFRILKLNEIYIDVYRGVFGALVYFDEASGEWKLDKNLPNPWRIEPAS